MINQNEFLLADHFIVNFDTNEITVMTNEEDTNTSKIEPRIIKVLEILVKNSPNVVSREQ